MMKHIYYAATALLALSFASCSNEDIDIETTGATHEIACTVRTQNIYEKMGSTNSITEQILRDGSFEVGVDLLVYDTEGGLVTEHSSSYKNLNSYTETLTIPEGSYTLVTVQTIVDSESKESPFFSLAEKDDLSTLKINCETGHAYWYGIVGVDYTDLTVYDDMSCSIEPEPIGSVIDVSILNFDKSDYPQVAFGTKDVTDYYRLDPSVSQDDRAVVDLAQSDKFNSRDIFYVDSPEMRSTLYLLDHEIAYNFYVKEPENLNNSKWSFWSKFGGMRTLESGVRYAAGCYYQADDKFDTYFGTPEGYQNWVKSLGNDNMPLIPSELSTNWGASVSKVQGVMSGYTMVIGSSGVAVEQEDGTYALEYKGRNGSKVNVIDYFFTSARTGLTTSAVIYNTGEVSISALDKELQKSYQYLNTSDGQYLYLSSDSKTAVVLQEIENACFIFYFDYNALQNVSPKLLKSRTAAYIASKRNMLHNTRAMKKTMEVELCNFEVTIPESLKCYNRF